MKLKLGEVVTASEALGVLSNKSLPAATAFRVARMVSAVKGPMTDFDAARGKLLQEIGEPDPDNPQQYRIKDAERWNAEMNALTAQEVDLPDDKLKLDDFGKAEIEPRVLVQLSWFIEL